jgi:putative PEP-CTERM system TPR-repeat lipoprotein
MTYTVSPRHLLSSRTAAALALALALGLSGCGSGPSEAELKASAQALLAKKDVKGAVIQLKSALQKNPESAELRLMLGQALLTGGDPVSAQVELRKAQELQSADELVIPEIARAMVQVGEETKLVAQYGTLQLKNNSAAADLKTSLAIAYGTLGNLDKARSTADEALSLQPSYAPAMIVLSRLGAARGDVDGALAQLDQALKADPGNEQAGIMRGDLLLQAKRDTEGAKLAYREVLKTNPGAVLARVALINIEFQQGKLPEAKTEFAELQKLAPQNPETLLLEARLAFADQDYKRAREITEQILKGYPNNVRVLELAGTTEFRLKNFVQSQALLARALKLAPKQLMTRQMLGQAFLRSGEPAKTIEVLQPALDAAKPDGATLSLAGEAYLQLGDAKRSEEAFQRAVKAAPTDARVRTTAAIASMERGNTAGAATELEALAAGNKNPRADLALVSAKLRQNDLAGALKAIDSLERKLPDQALPLQLRGRVLALKGDVPGATKNFEAALAKEPAYFASVASLAALDLAARKPDDARKRFEAHLKANPTSWQAKMALAELETRIGAPSDKVSALLREAIKLNPTEPRPHTVLVNQLIGLGDGKGAMQAGQDAVAALPNNLEVADALGRAELANGDHQKAISTFKKLVGLQPRNALFEMRLADAYMAAKDDASATRSLRHAAELSPDALASRRSLALIALRDKRPQDAVNIARDLQKSHPKDATGFVLEGEIEASRKGWDAATAAYRAALQRGKSPEVAARLFATLTSGGKAAEAERFAVEWAKDNPKDAAFQYFLADLSLAQNDLARAEARYRAVLAIQPENALALNNVAWLMAKKGQPGAVAMAEKANSLLPERAPLLDTLAIALEAENQLPKAIETQKRAIALDPRDNNLTLRLAKLYIKSGDKSRARAELEALAKQGEKFEAQAEVATLLKTL